MADLLWHLLDIFFPLAQPPSKAEAEMEERRMSKEKQNWEERVGALPNDERAIEEAILLLQAANSAEIDRQRAADSRLTAIIGFASVAGSIAFGAALIRVPTASNTVHWIYSALLVYVMLQIVSAIWAAVKGLDRRAYRALTLPEMLPNSETRANSLRRRAVVGYEAVAQNRRQNNSKITQMAVSYRAIRNFLFGILIFAILAGLYTAVSTQNVRPGCAATATSEVCNHLV